MPISASAKQWDTDIAIFHASNNFAHRTSEVLIRQSEFYLATVYQELGSETVANLSTCDNCGDAIYQPLSCDTWFHIITDSAFCWNFHCADYSD